MTEKISDKIRKRIVEEQKVVEDRNEALLNINTDTKFLHTAPSYLSTQNISEFIEDGELDLLVDEVAENMQGVLSSLVIDTENDHNTQDTAKRVAKMFVLETFGGRYVPMPKATSFPNVTQYDQIYIAGPIEIKSTCAHHLQNISGTCWIGIKPGKDVIGLSKFNRIVDWLARRPSIQEELSEQIADAVEEATKAEGVAVFMRAEHACMTHRGVKAHCSDMKTSVVRGVFRKNQSLKDEFFRILAL